MRAEIRPGLERKSPANFKSGGRRRRRRGGGPGAPRGREGRAGSRQGAPCPRLAPEGGFGIRGFGNSGIQCFRDSRLRTSGLRSLKIRRFRARSSALHLLLLPWGEPSCGTHGFLTQDDGCLTVLDPALLLPSDPVRQALGSQEVWVWQQRWSMGV